MALPHQQFVPMGGNQQAPQNPNPYGQQPSPYQQPMYQNQQPMYQNQPYGNAPNQYHPGQQPNYGAAPQQQQQQPYQAGGYYGNQPSPVSNSNRSPRQNRNNGYGDDKFGQHQSNSQMIAETYDNAVRAAFMRKVFMIVGAMLLVSAAFIIGLQQWADKAFATNDIEGMKKLRMASIAGMVGVIAILCTFNCCPDTQRRVPLNYGLLTIFSLCFGLLSGAATVGYTKGSVGIAALATAVVCGGCVVYALKTDRDITGWGMYLFVIMFSLMGVSLLVGLFSCCGLISFAAFKVIDWCISLGFCLLFSVYLVFDVQRLMGNKKYNLSIDDYVPAAINIYLDIMNIFLLILELFGERR